MKRAAPTPAELALEACLTTGMPADRAACVAELAAAAEISPADLRRMTKRLTKLFELAKSWGAFGDTPESGHVVTTLLIAAAGVVRRSVLVEGGEELFMLLARAVWQKLEETAHE
jgi:hypothetical protein